MRWRTVLGGVLGVALLAYVIVAFWPRASTEASWYTVPADAQPMVVSKVLSGDTVVLVTDRPGEQVQQWGPVTARLIGVDAPNFGITPECYAVEADGRLRGLLPVGSIAWVTTDATPQDAGGRWLSYVWTEDGRLVNQLLAADGYVKVEESPGNDALWPVIQRAGAQAAARFGGLWGACRD